MVDLSKIMERECLHSEHAAQCVIEARRRDKEKKRKNGVWYQRGFDSANYKDLIDGRESPKERCQIVGDQHDFSMHRYPLKSAEFIRGYWDSIEYQRNNPKERKTKYTSEDV